MNLVPRVLLNLEKRRENILSGRINCIPTPFPTFQDDYPGVEQGKLYLVSGASKSGKTQLSTFLFLYQPILFAYYNPGICKLQIFYFPLEETPEKITMRFMCYLLYTMSGYKIRISPMQLSSVNEKNIVPKEILDILNSIEYRAILDFYEDHVHFLPERNPTGICKAVEKYAKEAGTTYYKNVVIENKETGVRQTQEVFDYYEAKDPDEYVIIVLDHVSLLDEEKGMTLKARIDKMAEYFIRLRNRYNYTPVILQQQNSETLSLEAVTQKRVAPTLAGLADSKDTGKACSVMLGITNPFAFNLPRYPSSHGYDITKLRGYARFMEVVLNREGESNNMLPLFFDGATNYFCPLPKLSETQRLNHLYEKIKQYMGE